MGERSTTVVGSSGQAPASMTPAICFSKRCRISCASFSGSVLAARDQRGGQQRAAVQRQQLLQHLVVGHAQADGLALRMAQAARHLAGGFEDEGERARRRRLSKRYWRLSTRA
jgi:hypothetical protein